MQGIEIIEKLVSGGFRDENISSELLKWMKSEAKNGRPEQVLALLPSLVHPDLDYSLAQSLYRLVKQIRPPRGAETRDVRIALLGTMTTHPVTDLLDLFLYAQGISATFYEADYATIHQEFLDPTSGLHQFQPNFTLILTSWRDLRNRPRLLDSREETQRLVEDEVAQWGALWKIAREQLHSQLIQSNFVCPPWRALGNLETSHPGGLRRFITRLNYELEQAAPSGVVIHDVDGLAAAAGRWQWSDERFYFQAKLPCAPGHLVDYAHSLAALLFAQLGSARKCLVLDLDNTLWGGVIGDDGIAGIRLGQGNPEGEAFIAFQSYAKALRERGVILAVCSKNDEHIAREVFETHPEMVLKLDDISCFVANWDDKASNLARVARELNIGLNSLVFFDDNPAERSLVRRLRPEVAVPEVPEDPAYFIQTLDRLRLFEAVTVSTEDLARTESYRADSKRHALASSTQDIDEFLRSLEMAARIGPVSAVSLERAVQLISRSNQFNLTTRRYNNTDVLEMSASPGWITRTVSLRDRFGDTGLISVLLARIESDTLVIDTWVMSCRVLKRGVERLLRNEVVAAARDRGLRRVLGEYIPTAKNGLVRDHFRSLGFEQTGGGTDGTTQWELRIDNESTPLEHFIREIPADEPVTI
jgi:FkbH-like protein